jgi:hypothetical protein
MSDIGGIDDIVGFHIRLAHAAVYRHFTETFVDLDLTQKQVSALWLVDDHPGHFADRARRAPADGPGDDDDHRQPDAGARLHAPRALGKRRAQAGAVPDRRRRSRAGPWPRGCIAEHEAWLKSRFTPDEVKNWWKCWRESTNDRAPWERIAKWPDRQRARTRSG